MPNPEEQLDEELIEAVTTVASELDVDVGDSKFKKHHYVQNSRLLEVYKPYREAVLAARAAGTEEPEMPRYYAESMIAIAKHLSFKNNFIGYSWRDEFIGDAIENMLQYKVNFNPEKSSNIFAYLSTISYYAFVRRITKEKKQGYIKSKMIQQMPIEDMMDMTDNDDPNSQSFVDFLRINNGVDTQEYEDRLKKKRQRKTATIDIEEQLWEDESEDVTIDQFEEDEE